MEKLSHSEYQKLHPVNLQPLDIMFDIDLFEEQMKQYRLAFRQWGEKHTDLKRYGLPLVNSNGSLHNNPELTCIPIDQTNDKLLPEGKFISDNHFNVPTEALNLSCFDVIESFKPYMIRSCILHWMKDAKFYTHTDLYMPAPFLRLWGTTKPDGMQFRFDKRRQSCHTRQIENYDYELVAEENVEAGRLYLVDSFVIHDAFATDDDVYQFFIALTVNSIDEIKAHLC